MAKKRGSVKPKPKIAFNWHFRFWDLDPSSALPRGKHLAGQGFEKKSKAVTVSMSAEGGDPGGGTTKDAKQLTDKDLKELTDENNSGAFDLHLQPPAGHDSGGPAGPDLTSPKASALWNKPWQIQFRPATFKSLQVDADGFFVVDGADEFFTCHVPDDLKDQGVPPHAVLRIFQIEGEGEHRFQRIEADIRFDVLRPTEHRKDNEKNVWLETKTMSRSSGGVSFDRPYLVIHCTGHVPEADRAAVNARREKKAKAKAKATGKDVELKLLGEGSTYIGTQLQTLTGRAAIHYLVNIDGHVVKIVEEDKGAHQAGFDPRKDADQKQDLKDAQDRVKKQNEKRAEKDLAPRKVPTAYNPYGGGWRDFVFFKPPKSGEAAPFRSRFTPRAKIRANNTSIGIEHVAGADNPWPQAQIDGSIGLIKRICKHNGILPCDVIRHRDLCFKSKQSVSGHDQKTHHPGKICPGAAVPWKEYQDEKVTLWPLGEIPGEEDQKLVLAKDQIYGGVFNTLSNLDDAVPADHPDPDLAQKQTDAIGQLQDDIERIGYWCLNKKSENRGIYDEALTHGVSMIQERFMTPRGVSFGAVGKLDWNTAMTVQRILAHGADVLPDLPVPPAPEPEDDTG